MRRPGPRREHLLQRGEGGLREGLPPLTACVCGGEFAFAIQPHREVRPESGLPTYEILDMEACRITTLFWGRGAGRGGGRETGNEGEGRGGEKGGEREGEGVPSVVLTSKPNRAGTYTRPVAPQDLSSCCWHACPPCAHGVFRPATGQSDHIIRHQQHSRLPWCPFLFRLRSFNGGGWAGRGKAERKRGGGEGG